MIKTLRSANGLFLCLLTVANAILRTKMIQCLSFHATRFMPSLSMEIQAVSSCPVAKMEMEKKEEE